MSNPYIFQNSTSLENENEDEIEECTPTYNASFAPEDEGEAKKCHRNSTDTQNEFNYVESIEDYGIKYLFEDLHVSRQINSRLVGLKTSTFVLTVCLSVTLGVYLGNCKLYFLACATHDIHRVGVLFSLFSFRDGLRVMVRVFLL